MRNHLDPNNFISDPGSPIHILYAPVVLDDGSIVLKESGSEDIQDYIDSFRDQTDMRFIVKRLEMGDNSVFVGKDPMYGDFTHIPKSSLEALQLVLDAEKKFDLLPLDVRNSFDNDFRKWFASAGSDDWYAKMDSVLIKEPVGSESEKVSEVVKDES